MLFMPKVAMTIKSLVLVILAISLSAHVYADAQDSSETPSQPDRLFQQVRVNEAAAVDSASALVMGTYVLDAKATKRLLQVDTLMEAINRIRLTDWKTGVWTKRNAELTIRQRMDDYLQTAGAFYRGEGKRPTGAVGRRLEKYTDIELGDEQLASALMTVRMATAWDVPLEAGQAERLDAVIRLRLAKIVRRPNGDGTMQPADADEPWMYPVSCEPPLSAVELNSMRTSVHYANVRDGKFAENTSRTVHQSVASFDDIVKWYSERLNVPDLPEKLSAFNARVADDPESSVEDLTWPKDNPIIPIVVTHWFTANQKQITFLLPEESGSIVAVSILGMKANTRIQVMRRGTREIAR
jgi:hypothetical protein